MVEQLQQINWVELMISGLIVGGLIGLIILLLEYGIFVGKKKPYKAQQVFKYRLDGVSDKHKQDVEVLYKGRSVINWGNIVLEFGNDGRRPIRIDDFEKGEPIRFIFPEDTIILAEPEIVTYPNNLRCVVGTTNNHIIEINPLLLNRKEYFILNILAENPKIAELDVRIAGVTEVMEKEEKKQLPWITLIVISIIGLFSIISASVAYNLPLEKAYPITELLTSVFSMGFVIAMIIMIIRNTKKI